MSAAEEAQQQYYDICDLHAQRPSETIVQAIRNEASSVFAVGNSIGPLLDLLATEFCPFFEIVTLTNVPPDYGTPIARFLEVNKNVKEFHLSKSKFGDARVLSLMISLTLSESSPLITLGLADVGLTAAGAEAVSRTLRETRLGALRFLNLTCNYIDYPSVVKLQEAAKAADISIALEGNLWTIEFLNTLTHAIGAAGALYGTWRIMNRALSQNASLSTVASLLVFSLSLCTMMTCSAVYHGSHRSLNLNKALRKADHCAIFVLIAGTYTPFCVSYTMDTRAGPITLAAVWICAAVGLGISLGAIKASSRTRALFALGMGWIGAIPAKVIYKRMQTGAIALVFAGGLVYSLGLIFYFLGRTKNPMHHVVWHLAVMLAGLFHYLALWHYVLPSTVQ